jgi:hypothetical protein
MTLRQAFAGLLAFIALAALLASLDTRSSAPSPDPAVEAKRTEICTHAEGLNEPCLIYLRLNNLP